MMECRVVCMSVGGGVGDMDGGCSQESEHDLAVMVTDFLENGSGGAQSRWSSDSDSGFCNLAHLEDKISHYKLSVDQYENDLLAVVNSLMLSIKDIDLHLVKSGPCNASCIRFSLVKLLRLSGFDAAVRASRWQGSGKVPGGDHEYIDVVNHNDNGSSENFIIDIDFRSHFEIARAVQTYDRILDSLPVVYVGSSTKLKQFLQVMVEAARSSLKQNSMPLPPWRSLPYLQAKWESPCQRKFNPDDEQEVNTTNPEHKQCSGHLKRLQSLLQSEIKIERTLKPKNNDKNWKWKFEWQRHSSFRAL